MKRPDNKTFLICGILIALVIGVAAIFFASNEPDSLESTALVVQGVKDISGPSPESGDAEAVGAGPRVYSSPFPDYSLGKNSGVFGRAIIMIAGILIMVLVVLMAVRLSRISKE